MTDLLPRIVIEPKNPKPNVSRNANLPHSPGIRVGDYIFLSGIGSVDPVTGGRNQAGQAASAGVFSAVLAQTGFTGARNIFNGRFGFFELYQPNGYDASVLLRDLGTV